MAKHFSPEVIEAMRKVVRTLKENSGWARTSRVLGGISRYKLDRFIDPERQDGGMTIPSVDDLRVIITSLSEHIEHGGEETLVALCGKELELLLEDAPKLDQFRSLKRLTQLEEEQQEDISRGMSGNFMSFRRHREKGVLISHIKVADTYARTGLASCLVRQSVQGEVYSIEGTVFRRDRQIYILGYDRQYGHMRTHNLLSVGASYDLFVGLVSGFEPFGPAFSSRVIVARLPSDEDFDVVKNDTGHFETFEAAEVIAEQRLGRVGLLSKNKLADEANYISVALE